MNKSKRRLIALISAFSILINSISFWSPLLVLAQETPESTPVVEMTPEPTVEPTAGPTVEPTSDAQTNYNTPTPEVTTTPTLEPTPQNQVTESNLSQGVLGSTSEPSPSATIQPEVQTKLLSPSPESTNTEKESNPKLDAFVVDNVKAGEIEEPDLSYIESTSATLKTDKFDYAPTDAVVITGSGFLPNTEYEVAITSETGNFRFSDKVTTDESGSLFYTYQLDGTYRPNYLVEVKDTSGTVVASVSFTDAQPTPTNTPTPTSTLPCIIDTAGANDEPGQKDLTMLCRNLTQNNPLEITWNWDETSMSGSNTADACALFDTDNDGLANYAICVTWNNGQSQVPGSPTLYSCNDTRSDRCAGSTLIGSPSRSSCTVTNSADDPFPAGASYPNDTKASCSIDLADIGNGSSASLLDVCSYPSTQPNSDPSDCVIIRTDKGSLTIIKDVVPDDSSTNWNFAVTGPTNLNLQISGDGSTGINSVDLGTYTITETAGNNTNLNNYTTQWSCTKNGFSYLSGTGTSASGIQIGKSGTTEDSVVCTFTNTLKQGTITIVKDAQPNDPQDFSFTGDLGNFSLRDDGNQTSPNSKSFNVVAGTYTVTENSTTGWNLTDITCNDPTGDSSSNLPTYPSATIKLAAGENVTCTFTNTKRGSISGYKYEDINGNGSRDENENNLLPGWTIALKQDNNEIDSTTTGQDGAYSFINVIPGDYQVCEVLSEGWIATDPTGGNCKNVTVGAGQDVQVNFGNFELGKVSGYKYGEDGETGLPGWTIFIDENKNRILDGEEVKVQTDNDGYFEFTGLTAGTYSICEVEQSGWQRMYPSGTNCQNLVIISGSDVKNLNFQNRKVVLGLSLTKSNSAVSALSSGSEVTYTLVIKNTGNQRLTGVTIKDAPSGGFSYVSGSGLLEGNPITPTVLSGYLEWYIDTLEASGNEGDTKTLTYKMVTSSDLPSGVYPNIAIATGIYTPYEYGGGNAAFRSIEVLAVSEDADSSARVESNEGTPVNSQVELKQVLAYSTGVGVVGQVLGAATEAGQVLPAAGSDTRFFVFAIAALIFGLFLKFGSFALNRNWIDYRRLKKGLKNIFASILFLLVFSLFAPFAKAFSDYVSITKFSSYINKEDFKISYSALSENPISAQFYVRKDGDSSWRTLGSSLTGASGYVQVSGGDIYNGDGKYFFKVVINGGTAEDETSTIVDRQAPDAVRDYRKEKLGDGHYKLYWRNPDNEDFDKVIIYRSDSTNFTADSSTEVATIWGSRDAEMTSENAAAPGKEYYFAIRAIDKAGNASSVVSDPETQVSAGAVLGASVSATSTPEVVKILPKEKKTGEVLGEEKTEEATPSPTLTPQEEKGGVLGQAVKFAKDRTKLTVGIIAVLLFAGYLGLRKFRSGEKK